MLVLKVSKQRKVNLFACTDEIFLCISGSIVNPFLFIISMEPNVGIQLLAWASRSAMERGLRDHSKPFHYEGLLLWEMKAYFYF